jgi:DNA-binding NtrC family response regulator
MSTTKKTMLSACERCPRALSVGPLCKDCNWSYKRYLDLKGLSNTEENLRSYIENNPYIPMKKKDTGGSYPSLSPGFLICGPTTAALAEEVRKIAGEPDHVLIQGDTGTGKEGVARALHDLSPRALYPFITVNCACITNELADSEFFGYEKGAFTGALANKNGLFVAAHGGTLFLDEIESLPLTAQGKLLRVLSSGETRSVGARKPIITDVRVIAATKLSLDTLQNGGSFRPDLFFRFPFSVSLTPLKDRPEEIPHLVRYYLTEFLTTEVVLEEEVMQTLMQHTWPGNVRELMNVIKRAIIMRSDERIQLQHLPAELRALSCKVKGHRLESVKSV